jgi:hypothetical protein
MKRLAQYSGHMPMDAAQLTLAKLNSFLGGKGPEWGTEEAPAGAALPVSVRGQARILGNEGHTAQAADLLLKHALTANVRIPAHLLDEVERAVLPAADSQSLRSSLGGNLAVLRHNAASGASLGGNPVKGFFARLFGR